MKMLLREGKIIDNSDLVYFKDTTDVINLEFRDSFKKVLDFLEGYEVNKYSGNTPLDLYYLYYFKTDSNDIEEVLDNLLDNNEVNIINNSTILLSLYKMSDSTIFWDVRNHVIIVIGLSNLKRLLYNLEELRWTRFITEFKSKDFEEKYINIASSNVYKKVLKMK